MSSEELTGPDEYKESCPYAQGPIAGKFTTLNRRISKIGLWEDKTGQMKACFEWCSDKSHWRNWDPLSDSWDTRPWKEVFDDKVMLGGLVGFFLPSFSEFVASKESGLLHFARKTQMLIREEYERGEEADVLNEYDQICTLLGISLNIWSEYLTHLWEKDYRDVYHGTEDTNRLNSLPGLMRSNNHDEDEQPFISIHKGINVIINSVIRQIRQQTATRKNMTTSHLTAVLRSFEGYMLSKARLGPPEFEKLSLYRRKVNPGDIVHMYEEGKGGRIEESVLLFGMVEDDIVATEKTVEHMSCPAAHILGNRKIPIKQIYKGFILPFIEESWLSIRDEMLGLTPEVTNLEDNAWL